MTGLRRAVSVVALALGASSCASWPFSGGQASLNPNAAVPDSFLVAFETSRGRVEVMARTAWAPVGVDRLHQLVQAKHFDDARFFRVVKDFVAQFGLASDPRVSDAWKIRRIADEPVRHTNARGTIAFARGGPGTRTVQLYINLQNNPKLDTLGGFGFPPIAEVVSGMSAADSLYSGYGEATGRGGPQPGRAGPSQDSIATQGNAYLMRGWPKLDYIKTARVVREWRSR